MTQQYIMSREQRVEALKALKGAVKYLWDGNLENSTHENTRYICFALNRVSCYGCDSSIAGVGYAKALVSRSLQNFGTYTAWLVYNGHSDAEQWPVSMIQAERLRWMKVLIKALERSLK